MRILIVDDEFAVGDIVNKFVTKFNHNPVSITDPDEAIEVYRNAFEWGDSFDLVFLDYTFHGRHNGDSVLKELLNIDSNAKVVLMTGDLDVIDSFNPLTSEYKAVLVKPFTMKEVKHLILKFGKG